MVKRVIVGLLCLFLMNGLVWANLQNCLNKAVTEKKREVCYTVYEGKVIDLSETAYKENPNNTTMGNIGKVLLILGAAAASNSNGGYHNRSNQGCCSWHKGVSGYYDMSSGYYICRDNTLSKTCNVYHH